LQLLLLLLLLLIESILLAISTQVAICFNSRGGGCHGNLRKIKSAIFHVTSGYCRRRVDF
jgi:hypothetical protein